MIIRVTYKFKCLQQLLFPNCCMYGSVLWWNFARNFWQDLIDPKNVQSHYKRRYIFKYQLNFKSMVHIMSIHNGIGTFRWPVHQNVIDWTTLIQNFYSLFGAFWMGILISHLVSRWLHSIFLQKVEYIHKSMSFASLPSYKMAYSSSLKTFSSVIVGEVEVLIDDASSKQCELNPIPTWLLKMCKTEQQLI